MSLGRLAPLLSLVLAACGTATSSTSPKAADSAGQSPFLGQKLTLSLPSSLGSLATIGNGGQALVLELWATSCRPCKTALPALVARQDEIQAKGAPLILVAVLAKDESTDAAKAKLASWGVNLPFLVDSEQAIQRTAGVNELPATIVLDNQHNIRWIGTVDATASDVIDAIPRQVAAKLSRAIYCAHWSYADSYRLRQKVLWDLGLHPAADED